MANVLGLNPRCLSFPVTLIILMFSIFFIYNIPYIYHIYVYDKIPRNIRFTLLTEFGIILQYFERKNKHEGLCYHYK